MVYSPQLYQALRGVFCIYKPSGQGISAVCGEIKRGLANELCSYKCRPVRQRIIFSDEVDEKTSLPVITAVPDLADDPAVVGARYMAHDFQLKFPDVLPDNASGVAVLSINQNSEVISLMRNARYMQTYHLSGEMGTATISGDKHSRVLRKAKYEHVSHEKMDRITAKMQAGHQKHMFVAAGVNMESQEAYELAQKGLLRPVAKEAGQVVYGMRCINFKPPNFTLEVHCVNEDYESLVSLVHNAGVQLRCLAMCTQVRRVRYGYFTLDHALVKHEWTAQNIIENIAKCKKFTTLDKLLHTQEIHRLSKGELEALQQQDLPQLPSG